MNPYFHSIITIDYIIIILALLILNLINLIVAGPVFSGHHWTRRDKLISQENQLAIGGNISLNTLEGKVNEGLLEAKEREIQNGLKNPRTFLPAQSFLIAREDIEKSEVFKFIQKMPKGAVLHSHDFGIVSQDYVYSNITFRDNLYVCFDKNSLRLKFFDTPNNHTCNWKLLNELRKNQTIANELNENIQSRLTMIVKNPEQVYTDIDTTWLKFRGIFRFTSEMLTYIPVFRDYFYRGLEELYNDNVMYLELRSTLPMLYELDGVYKTKIDTVQILKEVNDKFVEEHPDFMGFKLIYAPSRNVSESQLRDYLTLAEQLIENYPNFVIGFDLVSQEDNAVPLRDIAKELKKKSSRVNYFFHAGETNWYGTKTDENLIDAIILKVKRIGHGYAITKHPKLLQIIRNKRIAIEVNPISNQVLHLVKDLRNHPASILFAKNYPVIVSNDDPGLWGAKGLSYDFYEAFMGMMSAKAGLNSLKQLAINSLVYSALNNDEKSQALSRFEQKWQQFVENIF